MRTACCSLLLAVCAAGCMNWPRPDAKPAAPAAKPKPRPAAVTPDQVSERNPYAAKKALEAELDWEEGNSPGAAPTRGVQ